MSTIAKINKLLKAAGRTEKLVRGAGYYYIAESNMSGLYVYVLTDADMQMAIDFVEDTLTEIDGTPFKFGASK
jgi:hypothetical protein